MNLEIFQPEATGADDSTLKDQQNPEASQKEKHHESADDRKKEKADQKQEAENDLEKKPAAKKIQEYQTQADNHLVAYKKQLGDTDRHNKELDAQAKAASDKADFIASITQSALLPGTINTEQTQVEKRTGNALEQQGSTLVATHQPVGQAAKAENNQKQENQTAKKEKPQESAGITGKTMEGA